MQDLHIPPTPSTPQIIARGESGQVHIKGDAYPENAFELFGEVIDWIERHLASATTSALHMELELVYLNTSSVRAMMDIFDELEGAHTRGADVSVTWYFDLANERAGDLAQEFKEDYTFPFQVIGRSR